MSYATRQDMFDRYDRDELVQLTDRGDPPIGDLDPNVMDAALADAEAEINGYIASRYTTPIAAPVPRILMLTTCAIARYRLWKDRASERVRQDYQDAVKWCRDVAQGTASLGDNVNEAEIATAGTPQFTDPCRVFSKDTLKDF
jgi:phage gp36-like protein